jgi:DNA repair exonuclease SbcCD ATPase subunit
MDDRDMIQRVTTLERDMKSAFNKLSEHDNVIKEIRSDQKILHEMNANIAVLAKSQEYQGKKIDELRNDVKELKEKPAKRWDTLATVIITSIASGLIGFILSKVIGS